MAKPVFATNDVPSATQFNSWLVNVLFARRTSTASVTSSTTLADDSQLTLAVEANATYRMTMMLSYDGATGGDLKVNFTMPAGASMLAHVTILIPTAAGQQDYQGFSWTGSTTTLGCLGGTASGLVVGLFRTAGTAGNLTLQWAQATSSGTSTRIFTDSFIDLRRVE